MKEMIQARKEQLQERGVSGFTLMEMLIVVAIIAVLVAIAIPVFTTQLNKAQAEADVANCRSYYAENIVKYMTDQTDPTTVAAGSKTLTISGNSVTLKGGTVAVTYTDGVYAVTYTVTNGAKLDDQATSWSSKLK